MSKHEPSGRSTASVEVFDHHRSLLFSVAYGMLGSVMDAEDVVQEAYLRWRDLSDIERRRVRSPKDYLCAVVTRRSIDRLRVIRARREEYAGPWLPEPVLGDPVSEMSADDLVDPAERTILHESLSMAFLVLLESLGPTERTVFLLREVFGYDYKEISRVVGKTESNCRQVAHRAREAVAARRPRFDASAEERERLVQGFVEASSEGDMEGLLALLAEDVALYSDGGGKVAAARNPVLGREKVARFVLGLLRKLRRWDASGSRSLCARQALVNGEPGLVGYADGRPAGVLTLEVAEGLIRAVRIVVNPEKLRSLPPMGGGPQANVPAGSHIARRRGSHFVLRKERP